MADILTRAQRSELMSRVRSRGNRRTELAMITLFRGAGITGWRRHRPIGVAAEMGRRTGGKARVTIRPDFVFPGRRVAVFVDGCFWHGCPLHGTRPKANAAFWRRKLATNRARDRRDGRRLARAGWKVVRVWEHAFGKRGLRALTRRMKLLLATVPAR
jgi:DNA mismatch endonuclease (patch repair protein)